jgi:hypothetical protein
METLTFSDEELSTISNALRVAAERFDECAKVNEMIVCGLDTQFKRQANQCRELYAIIADKTGYAS